ncbi:MAG: thiamine phosphate synthase [Bacteroidales bacterium]
MIKFIIISPPEGIINETKFITLLFRHGLKYFHLRKPSFSKNDLEQFIEDIPSGFRNRIILHNHYDVAEKYQLKGIHITNRTKNQGFEKNYKKSHISISTHSFNELSHLKPLYNYAFLSPVFDSISKNNYKSNFHLKDIQHFLKHKRPNTEIIALGGICADNIPKIQNLGFDGFAVMGGLWDEYIKNKDMETGLRSFQTLQNIAKIKQTT